MKVDKTGYWQDCYYFDEACDSYENVMRHFKYSEIAGNAKDYGFAVSHLVLGVQELIKAFVLICLNGNHNFIDNEGNDKIFKEHNFKY